ESREDRLSISYRSALVVNDRQRQSHGKGCTLILARTESLHGTSIQFRQMTHDGQAETKAAILSRAGRICLPEALENIRQEVLTDALAGVAHRNLAVRSFAFESNLNPAATRREFHGIGKKVPHDLLKAV